MQEAIPLPEDLLEGLVLGTAFIARDVAHDANAAAYCTALYAGQKAKDIATVAVGGAILLAIGGYRTLRHPIQSAQIILDKEPGLYKP